MDSKHPVGFSNYIFFFYSRIGIRMITYHQENAAADLRKRRNQHDDLLQCPQVRLSRYPERPKSRFCDRRVGSSCTVDKPLQIPPAAMLKQIPSTRVGCDRHNICIHTHTIGSLYSIFAYTSMSFYGIHIGKDLTSPIGNCVVNKTVEMLHCVQLLAGI